MNEVDKQDRSKKPSAREEEWMKLYTELTLEHEILKKKLAPTKAENKMLEEAMAEAKETILALRDKISTLTEDRNSLIDDNLILRANIDRLMAVIASFSQDTDTTQPDNPSAPLAHASKTVKSTPPFDRVSKGQKAGQNQTGAPAAR